MLLKYFKELVNELVVVVLFIVDIVIFIISAVTQKFTLPSEFYWIVAGIGFIIANIRIYTRLQKKIEEYESQEANIKVRVLECKVIVKAPVLADEKRVQGSRSADGLDDHGLPISHQLVAKVEIENTGIEQGTLVWELDLVESNLPEFFTIYENAINGYFDDDEKNVSLEIEGRDRYEGWWTLPLLLKEESPRLLAHKISNPADYRLLLHYKTKRIGGETFERIIVFDGDFTGYRDSLIKKWKARGLVDLVQVAGGAPLAPQIY